MANPEHLKILEQGVEVWNKWREENPEVRPDLSEEFFYFAKLPGAVNIEGKLVGLNLSKTDLSKAALMRANFSAVDLTEANLWKADMSGADFFETNLSRAILSETDLEYARLIRTNLSSAKIERANIYGISAWDIQKDGLIQKDLVITRFDEPEITVDDLEVAQFIYLMLNNEKIRDVIETITSKAVLILGRFTPERKAVLDALKDELRQRNYLPIVFDFENVGNKSVDETVNLLARMSRFVVADITDAKSIPQELRGIVPDNPSIPIVPLIWKEQREYGMFDHFRKYPWVLELHEYDSPEILLENIIPAIIAPAEQKVAELRGK